MKEIHLQRCEKLCEEFLKLAAALRIREAEGAYKFDSYISGCRESGALRRKSLDLTRALADLRRAE